MRVGWAYTAMIVALAVASVAAESTAPLTGDICAADGTPMAGATVQLLEVELITYADEMGRFYLPVVPVGTHTMVTRAPGFAPDTTTVTLPGPPVGVHLSVYVVSLRPLTVSERPLSPAERTTAFLVALSLMDRISRPGSVPALLEETPGVRISSLGGHGSMATVSIRGSTAEQVRVYMDGVPLNQSLDGGVNLATIPAGVLSDVEVFRGVIPPEYGGSGMGGVMNLRTLMPTDTLDWRVGTSFGTWGTRTANAWVSRSIGPFSAIGSAEFSSAENDFPYLDDNGTPFNPDDDEWARRQNNQFQSLNLMGRVSSGWRSFHWNVGYSYLQVTNHLPGVSTAPELEHNTNLRSAKHLAQVTVRGSLPLRSQVYALGYRSWRRDRFDNRDDVYSLGRKFTDDTTTTTGIRGGIATRIVPMMRIAADGSVTYESFDPDDRLITDPEIRRIQLIDRDRRQAALFLSDEVKSPDGRITLTGQVGMHHVRSRIRESGEEPISSLHWPYAMGLKLMVVPWLALQANSGVYLRIPNVVELFGDRGTQMGNPDLKPEKGQNRDVGVVLHTGKSAILNEAELQTVYFDNLAQDMIVYWIGDNGRSQPYNFASTHVRGIESSARIQLGGVFTLATSLTWQRPLNTTIVPTPTTYFGNDLPHQPRWQGDVRPRFTWGPFRLQYALRWTGRFFTGPRNEISPVVERSFQHDAGVSFSHRWATISFEGRNLSNVREFHDRFSPLPGRSWFISFAVGSR